MHPRTSSLPARRRDLPGLSPRGTSPSPMLRRALPVLAAASAALTLVPAGASAATKPARLKVLAVSSPPSGLQAGQRFTVTGKVKNVGGRSSAALVTFELRSRGGATVRYAVGGDQIAKIRPGSTRTFKARAVLASSAALKKDTTFMLSACAKRTRSSGAVSCRQASGGATVRVNAVPAPGPTPAPAPAPVPAPTPTTPAPPPATGDPAPPSFTPGARSLGDTLFPTIGNGGYDAQHYDLDLRYTVDSKYLRGTSTMTAVATQDLSELSLDLAEHNDVASVSVDGVAATFSTIPADSKLVITPAAGIRKDREFRVAVTYSGVQTPYIDPDGSSEGWIPDPALGATAVGEPVGAMGWFPNNNVPFDKATFTTTMTVPEGFSVLGTGTLSSKGPSGSPTTPTTTFTWDDPDLTATYLYSLSIGRFALNTTDLSTPASTVPAAGSLNTPVPFYTAIDSTFVPTSQAAIQAKLDRTPSILDYFAGYYGVKYPFNAAGGIVPLVDVGYSLETQGKPTYATTTDPNSTGVGISTVAHENGHMWFGDGVTLTQWKDIWLNEGMTEFSTWLWTQNANGGTTLASRYASNYTNSRSTTYWRVAPANPPTAADIFNTSAMYNRGATTMLVIHDVLGEERFRTMMRRYLTDNLYGNVTTERFIALVKETDPTRAARWTEFFRQWLYTSYTGNPATAGNKPTINIGNFDTFALPPG